MSSRLGNAHVKRLIYRPGTRWSTDVKPLVGTDRCMHGHVGFLAQGHLCGEYEDGCGFDFQAPLGRGDRTGARRVGGRRRGRRADPVRLRRRHPRRARAARRPSPPVTDHTHGHVTAGPGTSTATGRSRPASVTRARCSGPSSCSPCSWSSRSSARVHQFARAALRRRPHGSPTRSGIGMAARRHPPRRSRAPARRTAPSASIASRSSPRWPTPCCCIGVAVYMLIEALDRFGDPPDVLVGPMLVVAVLGLAANLVAFRAAARRRPRSR